VSQNQQFGQADPIGRLPVQSEHQLSDAAAGIERVVQIRTAQQSCVSDFVICRSSKHNNKNNNDARNLRLCNEAVNQKNNKGGTNGRLLLPGQVVSRALHFRTNRVSVRNKLDETTIVGLSVP
jgi:hypothetical protein